ncbi:aldolase/citrate lyase family protein [Mycobacterium sp. ACS4331]|uniref:HpcH/HpaI aldolase family protein n=1 Tax=Mycobacterium sp. ACS4331 TaxID=1834121 RepID=UPI0007FFB52D|nr:aldolase/citrate lyase family protein [Mycobacterium sp. ACS4331]OBF25425.1 aldolase [Mycobacterium sp. ACS4331]
MPSRIERTVAERSVAWGGWVVGPTVLGPEEFAQTGYDYVGFDTQHGYLSDADVALMLRRLEHVPIATVVRLPSADPAPIGRVLDAGADAVVIAMVETPDQAAQAVAATRYAPAGVRSFGPLRASMGTDAAELEARAGVFAMIETAAALPVVDEICAVPGLTGVYVGPADLAISMGHALPDMWTAREVTDAIRSIAAAANRAGVVAGIHAGTGTIGNMVNSWGFQMITLASESQALRRGAAEHLSEATGTTGDNTAGTKGYS